MKGYEYEDILQELKQTLGSFVPQAQDIHEDTDLVADTLHSTLEYFSNTELSTNFRNS